MYWREWKRLIVIYLFINLLSITTIAAQFLCKIEGTVKQNGKSLSGATVTLTTNEGTVKELVTNSNGAFSLNLEPNEEYSLFITKQGYIKAELVFSTMGFTEEEEQSFKNILKPEITLFELPTDEKTLSKINTVLNKPLKSYYYNPEKKALITDLSYDESMEKDFEEIKKIAAASPKAEPKEDESLANYQNFISNADKAFNLKDYTNAQNSYEEALKIKPSESYPKQKITEIKKILITQQKEAQAKAEEEKRIAAEKALAEAKEKERIEKEALAKAEEEKRIAVEKALAEAKEKERIEKEALAKAEEEKRIAAEKALAEAKEKERIEKEALAKAEEEKRIAAEKALAEAKEKERIEKEALAKAEEEKRIAAEKALAEAKEKERIEKEEQAKALIETNYKNAISNGDKEFEQKKLLDAKDFYNHALSIKPEENYPKEKIAEIDTLLATVYKNDLAKKYPQGVTEITEKETNAKITKRIVVKGNTGFLYLKRETNFGQTYYFKDGVPITEQQFYKDTRTQ